MLPLFYYNSPIILDLWRPSVSKVMHSYVARSLRFAIISLTVQMLPRQKRISTINIASLMIEADIFEI